jgi:AcrR family transcriptional regulator
VKIAMRKKSIEAVAKPRGRPLSFDRDAALENAMHVFWEHGYEAASVSDLTQAMGITPPSLYAAFGDKEKLFLEAIERYACGAGSGSEKALDREPTARGAIERMLEEAAVELTRPSHPSGCMVVMSTMNCSEGSAHVQAALAERRADFEVSIRERIELGIRDGELPADTPSASLASFYATVFQGMSVQARDGATRATLRATAQAAMRAWPAAPATAVRKGEEQSVRKPKRAARAAAR